MLKLSFDGLMSLQCVNLYCFYKLKNKDRTVLPFSLPLTCVWSMDQGHSGLSWGRHDYWPFPSFYKRLPSGKESIAKITPVWWHISPVHQIYIWSWV